MNRLQKISYRISRTQCFFGDDPAYAFEIEDIKLEQEPTTKNNLGVDAISREQALVAIRNLYPGMPRVDFNGSLRKWVDKYKPYIECDDAIKQLPSVTPQPRKGHWIDCDNSDDYSADGYDCSVCGVNSEYVTSYCPNCGAKMGGSET